MNKSEFISELDYYLKGIAYEDKRDIIYDYEEHFAAGIEQGKTEEEISTALGDPRIIAKQFRNDRLIMKAESNKSAGNLASAIFASVGLGFLNLLILPVLVAAMCVLFSLLLALGCVALSLVLALFSVLISFYAGALGLTLGGIGTILAVFAEPYIPEYVHVGVNTGSAVFLSIGLICIGALSFIGLRKLSILFYKWSGVLLVWSYNTAKKFLRGFYMWILKYLKMNVNIITRKKENEDV